MSDKPNDIFIKKWTHDPTIKNDNSALSTLGVHNAIKEVAGVDIENEPIIILDEEKDQLVLNPIYNPGLNISFNGKVVALGATDVNLAGTVTVSKNAETGVVKIQVGDNMCCSSWNNVDGSTEPDGKASDGYVSRISTSSARCPNDDSSPYLGDWTDNATVPFTKTQTITFTSKENIHIGEGDNLWTITVYDATDNVICLATLTDTLEIDYDATDTSGNKVKGGGIVGLNRTVFGNTITYDESSTIKAGISTTNANLAVEDNYPSAVGGRYKRTFTFDLSKFQVSTTKGRRLKIVIEGCGGKFTQTAFYYLKGEVPVVGSSSLTLENESYYKFVSGVKYLTSGTTFTLAASGITNLNNELGVIGNKLTINSEYVLADVANVDTAVFTSPMTGCDNTFTNTCGYSKSGIGVTSNVNAVQVSCNITPTNAYSSGSAKSTILPKHLVNTYGTASTDLIEYFQTEDRRLNSTTFAAWSESDKSTSLVTNTKELQVIPGVGLLHPASNPVGDYATYVPMSTLISNSVITTAQAKYNSCTGTRQYVRKFTRAGSLPGATLTFGHNAEIKTLIAAGKIKLEASKNLSKWYDISFPSSSNELGKSDSSWGTTSSDVVFLWNDGDANGFFYIRISMTADAGRTITEITYTK